MTDRKILFRGFHPDDNGTTTIIIDGKEIKGTWMYGDLITCIFDYETAIRVHNAYETGERALIRVLPETVGQWVTTDKNGKNVFEWDCVKAYTDSEIQGIVEWQKQECRFLVELFPSGYDWLCMDDDEWEVWGNKFENEVIEK